MELPEITSLAKDAAYVAVGLGLMGFQRAQVRRVEITRDFESRREALETQLAGLRTQVAAVAREAENELRTLLGAPASS
jgi:hypothetical protein